MKKFLMISLVFFLLLATSSPALAGYGRGKGGKFDFTLVGYVTSLDASSITVNVVKGSRLIHNDRQQNVEIQVTEQTRFVKDGVPISFSEVQPGDGVSVSGWLSGGVYTASRVTVNPACLP